ncbi:putative stereocilin-like protein [Rhinoderma darwinii]|uniref:putative stereocilin-like protein n=1 Tax=Rhinoderma darwinii TaxID=43563 RepID=UPI003F66CC12
MDDTFILRVGNLLPLFSLDVFLQLSTQQVVNILPSLPWDLTPPYQRIVASKVLQAPNITVQDVELMGRCVCQADVQDLKPYGQNMDISLALRRNLFECVRRGDFFPDSTMLEFLFGDLQFQDIRNFSLESVPKLSVVIRSLGYNFLQGLRPEQLLPVLSDVASVTLTSAQARELVQKVLKPGNT